MEDGMLEWLIPMCAFFPFAALYLGGLRVGRGRVGRCGSAPCPQPDHRGSTLAALAEQEDLQRDDIALLYRLHRLLELVHGAHPLAVHVSDDHAWKQAFLRRRPVRVYGRDQQAAMLLTDPRVANGLARHGLDRETELALGRWSPPGLP